MKVSFFSGMGLVFQSLRLAILTSFSFSFLLFFFHMIQTSFFYLSLQILQSLKWARIIARGVSTFSLEGTLRRIYRRLILLRNILAESGIFLLRRQDILG